MKIIGGHKLYTYDEGIVEAMKSPSFRKAHEESIVRHTMAVQIREARLAKKISQATLAKRADMPQSVIARIESGRHSFSLTTLFRIAKVFDKEVRLA